MHRPIALGLLALLAVAPVMADNTPPPPRVPEALLNMYAYVGALHRLKEHLDARNREKACAEAGYLASIAYWQLADSRAYKVAQGVVKDVCPGGKQNPGGNFRPVP
jgi:hypothetical protein